MTCRLLCASDAEKLCITRTRVESRWYHESADFAIIAVDAVCSSAAGEKFVKAGLFCLRSVRSTHSMTQQQQMSANRDTNTATATASAATVQKVPLQSQSGCFYSVDVCSSTSARVQLEVRIHV